MSALLQDATAIVTGAAAGIGRAIATAAAREGARLGLADIDEVRGNRLAAELADRGTEVCFVATDVADAGSVRSLVEQVHARLGPPSVVFANAGIEGPVGPAWSCSEEAFLRVLNVNLLGIWRTLAAVLPGMIERGGGAIVATASVAGLVGAGGLAPYVASKHAVVGLVKSIAIEAASRGVRVNALCPGVVETEMVERLGDTVPGLREALLALKPMGRIARTDEIAEAAVWLASPRASFVTGHAFAVDGGYTAQ